MNRKCTLIYMKNNKSTWIKVIWCSKFLLPTSMQVSILRCIEFQILWNISGMFGIYPIVTAIRGTTHRVCQWGCHKPVSSYAPIKAHVHLSHSKHLSHKHTPNLKIIYNHQILIMSTFGSPTLFIFVKNCIC